MNKARFIEVIAGNERASPLARIQAWARVCPRRNPVLKKVLAGLDKEMKS